MNQEKLSTNELMRSIKSIVSDSLKNFYCLNNLILFDYLSLFYNLRELQKSLLSVVNYESVPPSNDKSANAIILDLMNSNNRYYYNLSIFI